MFFQLVFILKILQLPEDLNLTLLITALLLKVKQEAGIKILSALHFQQAK